MTADGPIAHLNWGILRGDWDDPLVAPFVEALSKVNGIARRSHGFVWRYGDHEDEDFSALADDPRLAATLSVWASAADLRSFAMRTLHGAFLRRREEWFVPQPGPTYVIWPVAPGHRPRPEEGRERLEWLAVHGPSRDAYDFTWMRQAA